MFEIDAKHTLKVILLCGGKGERLYPLTNDIPKPLLKIKDKPILSYIIEHLAKYDLHDLVITTGYKADRISDFIYKNYPESGFKLVDSGDVDIIKRIQDGMVDDNDFLVLYGDTISNIQIDKLVRYHRSNDKPATMTVWPFRTQFGIVDLGKDGQVVGFQEKPKLDKWINIGYFLFSNEFKSVIKAYDSFEVFLKAISEKRMLNAFKHEGVHITINTLKELTDAEQNIDRIGVAYDK